MSDWLQTLKDAIATVLADTGTDGVVVNSQTTAYKRLAGKEQIFEKSISAAANAGSTTITTVTAQDCQIESIIVHANAGQTADLTSCLVNGGANSVITFILAADCLQADLNAADKQVAWMGAVRLKATRLISMTLSGTGATPVDLRIIIKYRACVDGGYLV